MGEKLDHIVEQRLGFRFELVLVALLTLVGLASRLRFAAAAPGLWYDEAIYGLDSLRVLREAGWPIFFDTGTHMREPMYMYIQALALSFAAPSALLIRGTSALIGAVTIPVLWLLAREFGGRTFGLIAAAFFTVFAWHVHFSGLAFRTILSPLFSALTMLFLFRYMRTNGAKDAAWTGVFLGLGVYTYLAFRLMPFIIAVPLAVHWLRNQPLRTRILKHTAILFAIAFLIFLPLGINFLRNPEHFTGRSEEVSLTQRPDGFRLILRQARDVALMPAIRGDHVGKHNIPGHPQFLQPPYAETEQVMEAWQVEHALAASAGREPQDPHGTGRPALGIAGALFFYLGLIGCLAKIKEPKQAALLAWLLIGSLASILSFGAPNMLRLLMLTPAVALLAVQGVDVAGGIFGRFPRLQTRLLLILAAALVGEALIRTSIHMRQWPDHPMVLQEFNVELADMGEYLSAQPDRLPVRLPFGEHPTLTFTADGYRFNPPPEELGDRWWEFRTVRPFPPLEWLGEPSPDGRRHQIMHPAGIPMGELVEVERQTHPAAAPNAP